jgi:hypothetical protein
MPDVTQMIIIIINIQGWAIWPRSVSRVTVALSNVSSVFELFSPALPLEILSCVVLCVLRMDIQSLAE